MGAGAAAARYFGRRLLRSNMRRGFCCTPLVTLALHGAHSPGRFDARCRWAGADRVEHARVR